MLKLDERTQTLRKPERIQVLQDVDEPELYRDQFPYTALPRVEFDNFTVEPEPPEDIWITDTTFRDGQQARPPFTVAQTIRLYELLHELDGGTGTIRQCEFFLYSDKDQQAVDRCRDLGFEFPEITGWVRAVKSDFKLVKRMGLKETGILTSASDYHIFLKLRRTRLQAMEMYLDVVRSALDAGVLPRCHFEDITRADIHGFVLPFACELMKLADEAKVPIKIRLCDTMGFGVPFSGAVLPRSVSRIVQLLRHEAGIPAERLEWHGHNDFHLGITNAVTAWRHGCAVCNGALLSMGERTGNTPIEALVVWKAQLRGEDPKIDYEKITEIARYCRKEIGLELPNNYPLCGEGFNVTRAGIHADGLLKNEEIYNCFDTAKILGRPVGVAITDKSGLAGIKHWIEHHYQVEDLQKDDPRLVGLYDKIMAEYNAQRTSAISDQEMAQWTESAFENKLERQ